MCGGGGIFLGTCVLVGVSCKRKCQSLGMGRVKNEPQRFQ